MEARIHQDLLNFVAPCSLLCYTCPAYKDGVIARTAAKLSNYFEGYYDFNDANLPEQFRDTLPSMEAFLTRLQRYAKRPCIACRNQPKPGTGCIEGCVIPDCVRSHGVDCCGDCPDFPCGKARAFLEGINSVIVQDWLVGSGRIREVGLERYFEETKDLSHYRNYKKSKD